MSHPSRAHERVAASLPAKLQICDPETLRPLSAAVEGEIVDVSLGGVRIIFSELPASLADSLAPGISIAMAPVDKQALPHRVLHLKIAWFKARIEEGSASQASLGASYTDHTSASDRAALLAFAQSKVNVAAATQSSGRKRRILAAVAACAALALLAAHVLELRGRVAEQEVLIDSLRGQLAKATAHPPLSPDSRTFQRPERAPPARPAPAALSPPDADGPIAEKPPAPPALLEPAVRPAFLAYKVADPLEGVDVISVELLNGDLVGVLSSRAMSAQRVVLSLGYRCDGNTDGGTCVCQTQEMILPPNRRSEFACTPFPPLDSERVELMIGLKVNP
ncbi:MAG: PilZ domain-containing protein [Myxococcaceae bacterium]